MENIFQGEDEKNNDLVCQLVLWNSLEKITDKLTLVIAILKIPSGTSAFWQSTNIDKSHVNPFQNGQSNFIDHFLILLQLPFSTKKMGDYPCLSKKTNIFTPWPKHILLSIIWVDNDWKGCSFLTFWEWQKSSSWTLLCLKVGDLLAPGQTGWPTSFRFTHHQWQKQEQ